MQVEISRRKFLQGTVALSVVAASTTALSSTTSHETAKKSRNKRCKTCSNVM